MNNNVSDKEALFYRIFYPETYRGRPNPPFNAPDIIRLFEHNLTHFEHEKVILYFMGKYCQDPQMPPEPLAPPPLPVLPPPIFIYLPPIILPALPPSPPAITPPIKLLPAPLGFLFMIPKFLPNWILRALQPYVKELFTSEAAAAEVLYQPIEQRVPLLTAKELQQFSFDLQDEIKELDEKVHDLEVALLKANYLLSIEIEHWTREPILTPEEGEEDYEPTDYSWVFDDKEEEEEEEEEKDEYDEMDFEPPFLIEDMVDWEAFAYLEDNLHWEGVEYITEEGRYEISITTINWGIGWYNIDDPSIWEIIPQIVQDYVILLEEYLTNMGTVLDESQEI